MSHPYPKSSHDMYGLPQRASVHSHRPCRSLGALGSLTQQICKFASVVVIAQNDLCVHQVR